MQKGRGGQQVRNPQTAGMSSGDAAAAFAEAEDQPDAPAEAPNDGPKTGALSRYLQLATPKLKEHRDDVNEELGRRTKAKSERKAQRQQERSETEARVANCTVEFDKWTRRVKLRKKGMMRDPETDSMDEEIELGEEDGEEATDYWHETREDLDPFRERYPQHALMWFGDAPTEEDVTEAEEQLNAAQAELNDALAAQQEILQQPIESENEEEVGDYDGDEAEEGDGAKPDPEAARYVKEAAAKARAAFAKKREREAAQAKLTDAQRAAKEETAANRRHKAAADKADKERRAAEHPSLVKYKAGYERVKQREAEKDEAIVGYQRQFEKAKQQVSKERETLRGERQLLLEWFNTPEGKPEGWDPRRMASNYECFLKMSDNKDNNNNKGNKDAKAKPKANSARPAPAQKSAKRAATGTSRPVPLVAPANDGSDDD